LPRLSAEIFDAFFDNVTKGFTFLYPS